MRGRRVPVVMMAAFALLGAPAAHACQGARTAPTPDTVAKVQKATICLLNKQRRRAGLKKLRPSVELAVAATGHSQDMVARQYFEHDGPAGDTFVTRATAAGYLTGHEHAWGLGENLAHGTGGRAAPAAIVRAWMHSPIHRAVVLSKTARDAGIGLAAGTPFDAASGTTYTLDAGYVR